MGCGLGQSLWLLGKGSELKIGADIDRVILQAAEKIEKNREEHIRFVQASSDSLPFSDSVFTHLISRVTLNYVNQTKTLSEISRILKNNGVFYCRVEALGFDLHLIRNSHSFRELIGRLYDLINSIFYNLTGKQYRLFHFVKVGRIYCSKYRIKKNLNGLNMSVIYFRSIGKKLFFTKSFEIIAKKSNNI